MDEQEIQTNEIEDEDEEFDYGPPRGTVAFTILMLIGYILYYAYHYFEIFILRGA